PVAPPPAFRCRLYGTEESYCDPWGSKIIASHLGSTRAERPCDEKEHAYFGPLVQITPAAHLPQVAATAHRRSKTPPTYRSATSSDKRHAATCGKRL
ncbi:MAG: hypothetical protein ACKN9U_12230, partial [Pirellulaceae bacterium]